MTLQGQCSCQVLTKLLPLDFYLRTVEFHHPTPHWSPESHQVLTEDLNLHPQYLKLSRFYHTIFTKSHNKNRLYIFNFSRIVPVEPPPPLAPPPGDLLRLLKSGCIGRDGALVSFMCIFGGSGCLDFFQRFFINLEDFKNVIRFKNLNYRAVILNLYQSFSNI